MAIPRPHLYDLTAPGTGASVRRTPAGVLALEVDATAGDDPLTLTVYLSEELADAIATALARRDLPAAKGGE